MAKLIPAAKRIEMARALIQEAHDLPVPSEGGVHNFNYDVAVKAKLREARELVKLIPRTVGIPEEVKAEARKIPEETAQADREIFHG